MPDSLPHSDNSDPPKSQVQQLAQSYVCLVKDWNKNYAVWLLKECTVFKKPPITSLA
uniref:Uncharacterized protein n=1 Tax=Arundo donax TaxID=35708 RepID=A0A0A9HSA4_ARUDO